MKIQLLLAIGDKDYSDFLSRVLTNRYMDFEVTVCSSREKLPELLRSNQHEVVILDSAFNEGMDLSGVRLSFLLWSDAERLGGINTELPLLSKYQRISKMVNQILSQYAKVAGMQQDMKSHNVRVTVVWSPAGGCGKTSVALAYAAQLAGWDRKTVYLDLEPFSSVNVYFPSGKGKSLSVVFENLSDRNANVGMLMKSIRQEDSRSGIFYFEEPSNYEDMDILTEKDINVLIHGAISGADELVVDLGNACDEKTKKAMELADQIFLVVDSSAQSVRKFEQFHTQHSLYSQIAEKLIIIANRNSARNIRASEEIVSLPFVESGDPIQVYRTLSRYFQK